MGRSGAAAGLRACTTPPILASQTGGRRLFCVAQKLGQTGRSEPDVDRLDDKAVHPGGVLAFNLVGHDIRRDGDNRRTHAPLVGHKLPDNAGRRVT